MGHRKTPTGKTFLGLTVMALSKEQKETQRSFDQTNRNIANTQQQLEKLEREQLVKRAEKKGGEMRAKGFRRIP